MIVFIDNRMWKAVGGLWFEFIDCWMRHNSKCIFDFKVKLSCKFRLNSKTYSFDWDTWWDFIYWISIKKVMKRSDIDPCIKDEGNRFGEY